MTSEIPRFTPHQPQEQLTPSSGFFPLAEYETEKEVVIEEKEFAQLRLF